MTLQNLFDHYNIKHFTAAEVLKAKTVPQELWINIIPTVVLADHCRDEVGFPITLSGPNAGYRTWEDHAKVYKQLGQPITTGSLHLDFNALDLKPVSGEKMELDVMKDFLLNQNYELQINWGKSIVTINKGITGIGRNYGTFVHLDTRGVLGRLHPARW